MRRSRVVDSPLALLSFCILYSLRRSIAYQGDDE
jgi:hypothetical protein